jgi:hypothetical protein
MLIETQQTPGLQALRTRLRSPRTDRSTLSTQARALSDLAQRLAALMRAGWRSARSERTVGWVSSRNASTRPRPLASVRSAALFARRLVR